MNKRIIFLGISALSIVCAIVVIVSIQSSPKPKSSHTLTTNSSVTNDNYSSFPSIVKPTSSYTQAPLPPSSSPEHITPEEVARNFYSWYVTYPGISALSSGAYKTNPYISPKFKKTISEFAPFSENDDPVFCAQNKLPNFTTLPATTTPDGRQSIIIQSVPDKKPLHDIILVNINNQWLIDDTVCNP